MPWSTGTEAARSRMSSINYLSSIRTGKAGGLLFKKKKTQHALLIRKELESPFWWRKVGNRSTNLQILKNSVKWLLLYLNWSGLVVFLTYTLVIRRFKNMKLPNKWWTLKIYESELMAGMRPKYKNDAVFIQDPIQCAYNTKSDGLPEQETTDRLQKAVYSFSLWKH